MTTLRIRLLAIVGLGMVILGGGGCGNSTSNGSVDCVANPAQCACADDSKCADPSPRCDTRTGKCVACLPTADNCALSEHCIYDNAKGFTCVAKDVCVSADDCPMVNGKPQLCCDGKCADRFNDAANCGACGKVCDTVANANSGCVNGSCAVTMCKAGFGDCDTKAANGCESDVTSDLAHCGACGTPCAKAPNTTVKCEASKCVYECVADFADCDANQQNGCETSTSTNPKNCGGCGKTCPDLPNAATVACSAGACIVETCSQNFSDCNKNPGDGCEANITADANNCAGCGKRCPAVMNGSPGCAASSCGVGKCNASFGDCDGNVLNGCEQDLTADAKNCGACGMACMAQNAVLSCQAAKCQLQSCNQGFSDCDNDALTGCESPTSRDLKNCGACGVVCPVPANATAQCSNGVCGLGSCMYGWADCNKNLNDGCETDVLQVANCGGCGLQCPVPVNGVAACKQAVCAVGMCAAGFADCDNKFANGCEINVVADGNNCGGCGSVCIPPANMKSACAASKCVPGMCNAGYSDCNNNINDGCEVATGTDPKNCGACGKVCPVNLPGCANGVCINGWFPVGVQTNVPANMLAGWSECYRDKYGNSGTLLANIQNGCPGSKLMLACSRTADPSTLVALAWAPRADVLFDTGQGNVPHDANGVSWYYNGSYSWGFAGLGDGLSRSSCDTANVNPQNRLCWHTGNNQINGGYRCGSTSGLNGDQTWDRIIYQFP